MTERIGLYISSEATRETDVLFDTVEGRNPNLTPDHYQNTAVQMLTVAVPGLAEMEERDRNLTVAAFAFGAAKAAETDHYYHETDWNFLNEEDYKGRETAVLTGAMWADVLAGRGPRLEFLMEMMAKKTGEELSQTSDKFVEIFSGLKRDYGGMVDAEEKGRTGPGSNNVLQRGMEKLGYKWSGESNSFKRIS